MKYFKEKSNRYDNYVKFVYNKQLTDTTGIIYSVYFSKKDYRHNSVVFLSTLPVKYEKMGDITITSGCPMEGSIEIVCDMPRYNYKKLLEIATRIDNQMLD